MRAGRGMVGIVLAVLACGGTGVGPGDRSSIQLLQADPAAPAIVAFTIDRAVVAASVGYGESSPKVEIAAGSHQLAIESLSGPLASLQSELRAGKRYYLVSASGSLVLTESAGLDSSGHAIPPDTGQRDPSRAHLRFVNVPGPAGQLPGRVHLLLTSPATVDTTVQFGLDTGIASYSSLIYLNPGAVTIQLRPESAATVLAEAAFSVGLGEVKDVIIERDPTGNLRLRIVVEQ